MEEDGTFSARNIATFMYERPKLCIAFVLLLVVPSMGMAATNLGIASGAETFFYLDSDLENRLADIRETFETDEALILYYESDDVFSEKSLRTQRAAQQQLRKLKVETKKGEKRAPIRDIISLVSVDKLVGSEMKFRSEPLVPNPVPTETSALEKIRKDARDHPLIRELLLPTENDEGTAIVARVRSHMTDKFRSKSTDAVRDIIAEIENDDQYVGEFYLSGRTTVRTDLVKGVFADLFKLGPLSFLIMGILFVVFYRRLYGFVWSMTGLTIAQLLLVGVLATISGKINAMTGTLIPLITTLAAPILLHYFTQYRLEARESEHREAGINTLTELMRPVAYTSLTTAVAFGALAYSNVPGNIHFGLGAALTIVLMFFGLVPFCAAIFHWFEADRLVGQDGLALSGAFQDVLRRLAVFVRKQKYPLAISMVILVTLVIVGMTQTYVGHDNRAFFAESAPVNVATDKVKNHLGGAMVMSFWIEHENEDQFTKPEVLSKLDKVREKLLDHPDINRVTDIGMLVKYMHRQFWNGDPDEYRIPDKQEQIKQLFVLNTNDRMFDYINTRNQQIRIIVRSDEGDLVETNDNFKLGERILRKAFPESEGYSVSGAGRTKRAAVGTTQYFKEQVRGLIIGISLVFLLILLFFRSFTLTGISIVPNLFPVGIGYGACGFAGVLLNAPTFVFGAVALGVAVDDTIHFLYVLRESFEETDKDHARAVEMAIMKKGPAIIGTSLVLICGFLVYLVSSFIMIQHLGWVVSVAMLAAMVGDLLFIPAMFLIFEPDISRE